MRLGFCRGFLFCGLGCGRFLRIVDGGNDFADLYFLTFRNNRVEHAGCFGRDLSRNFVGLKGKKRVTGIDEIAGFLVPDGNDSACDRFTDSWNFYFDAHRA